MDLQASYLPVLSGRRGCRTESPRAEAAPGTSGGLSPPSLRATVYPRQASTKANSAPAPTLAQGWSPSWIAVLNLCPSGSSNILPGGFPAPPPPAFSVNSASVQQSSICLPLYLVCIRTSWTCLWVDLGFLPLPEPRDSCSNCTLPLSAEHTIIT